jgi:DNA repair protein RecO (recombination protein O)
MTPQTSQLAFVLHSRPYKEYQLLIDLLTEHDGKVSAIISSGNTLKSSKKPLLQPFSPITVSFKESKHALKKIRLVEPAGKSYAFKSNFLYSGFYLNELLVRLLGELIPCPALFEQYKESLFELNKKKGIEGILRKFEFSLLEELGLTLDFYSLDESPVSHFYFIAEQGFVPALTTLKNSAQPCYDKQHLLAIAAHEFTDPKVLYTCKVLMRQIMTPLLGNKPLNSRKLFTKK